MTNQTIAKILSLGPVSRIIQVSGRNSAIRRLFEHYSGAARPHDSMDAARTAIRQHRPDTCGHLETRLVASNFTLSAAMRMSDYPVLFWLQSIAEKEDLRIFDFGGGVGQTYVNYSSKLPPEKLASWLCQDLPEVVLDAGMKFFPDGLPGPLNFTADLREAFSSNVVLVAGALHYWENSMAELLSELGTYPRHFIINRSPMRTSGKSFAAVQQGVDWAVACRVHSFPELKAEMEAEGYTLVDQWVDPEKSLVLPLLPEWSSPYLGMYFRLNDCV
jgi:putative methyltransferase (TIGR04325 family)